MISAKEISTQLQKFPFWSWLQIPAELIKKFTHAFVGRRLKKIQAKVPIFLQVCYAGGASIFKPTRHELNSMELHFFKKVV